MLVVSQAKDPLRLIREIDLVTRPMHARVLHGLQMKHPTYGPACRLAQRWMHAHLFSGKFEPEAIELIMAHIFTRPAPYDAPATATTGRPNDFSKQKNPSPCESHFRLDLSVRTPKI